MKLDEIRKKVDQIDDRLLDLLSRRFLLSQKIGFIKNKNLKPVLDKRREDEILARIINRAQRLNLSKFFVIKLFREIINESKKVQGKI